MDKNIKAVDDVLPAYVKMPMAERPIAGFVSRETLFVERHKDTHMTLRQISLKYGHGKEKILLMLPKPDLVCPYGNHTRLWLRPTIIAVLGD